MGSSLRDDFETRLCHLERSVAESKDLLAMCSLSVVYITYPSPPLAKGDLGGMWK